ncbi:hypothetical protein JET14_11565 [Martelella lutilitoris]|uniref:DUF2946 domain-containing protein n=1 Tax=Martelella lutilitoris TaxID=2583532 RepID=A0A7T7KKL4_9HYPH|nr:hypothetical protein [Martelella lutilitoris]QQM28984.1 hypothetical protein JET14_11565 [Martelella lutilitoris]
MHMTLLRKMRAAVKVLCIVTAMLLGVLPPSVASSAARHCATTPEVAMHHAQPASALHDMDHRTDDGAKECCPAVCGLQAGITSGQPSGLLTRVIRDLVFLDLSARLKGQPVPPDFEPPRLRA